MSLVQSLRVINTAGANLLTVDDVGIRDGSDRLVHPPLTLRDRITATPVNAYVWTCQEGVWVISAVNVKCSVTGGAGTTMDVLVATGVTAPASGTTQLTATIAMTATAPFSLNGTLIASPTRILPGDSISRVIGGTPAGVEGILTISVKRIG